MPSIFITRPIPSDGLEMLKKQPNLEIDIYEKDEVIPREVLLKRVQGVDIILSILTDQIDAEVMDSAGPQLKLIANYAVGFNNINTEEAKKRGILVTNTPDDSVSLTVAEHTIALMLALSHRIVETDKFTRAGKYENWGPQLLLGTDMRGKTVGIIGAGRIGTAVAQHLHFGFDMKIIYNNHHQDSEFEEKFSATFKTKEDLLKESDFVTLHIPLLPETKHFISREELALMKKTAFLINTSRGAIVDEKALLQALNDKKIAGAGLDVYECEPLIDCDPNDNLELINLENVVLTPHTASATLETRQAMSRRAAQNILDFLKNGQPKDII